METTILNQIKINNSVWASKRLSENENFFKNLTKGQNPSVLWIGCSDSRVCSSEITGTEPGEIFVHRNIANMVVNSDINLLSVIEYAVKVLRVKHIVVCGHYECGGVKAAMSENSIGLIDNWITNIKSVYKSKFQELNLIQDEQDRFNRFVELNVIDQVYNIKEIPIVKSALLENQNVTIHGWVFNMHNGLIKDLIEI